MLLAMKGSLKNYLQYDIYAKKVLNVIEEIKSNV